MVLSAITFTYRAHTGSQSLSPINQRASNNAINFVKVSMGYIENHIAKHGPHSNTGCKATLKEMAVGDGLMTNCTGLNHFKFKSNASATINNFNSLLLASDTQKPSECLRWGDAGKLMD